LTVKASSALVIFSALVLICGAAADAAQPGPATALPAAAETSGASVSAEAPGLRRSDPLHLSSEMALVVDQETGRVLYRKNSDLQTPIASITKLMTAMVLLDAGLPLERRVQIQSDDVDHLRHSGSRLRVGTILTRRELLQLALMSSDNRAAAALARTYPGGRAVFVPAMNRKARELGMRSSRFADPTGLNAGNVSTAEDLVRMVRAALRYPLIQKITTTPRYLLALPGVRRPMEYRNTNVFVRNDSWDIGLSKTGYIKEAGRCLVMQAMVAGRPLIMVTLNAQGKLSGFGDANRIRRWLESGPSRRASRG
jgi:D-alanyl-D-alanine endopeptidase (penicillin-binding protein 7)